MEAQLTAPDRLAHVPEPIRRTLAQVKRELVDFYGDKLQKVVLFGSYARGDFHDESDVDVMPVIDGATSADLRRDDLFDLAYSHMEKEQIHVSFVPTLSEQYKRAGTFLLMFVQKDGIDL